MRHASPKRQRTPKYGTLARIFKHRIHANVGRPACEGIIVDVTFAWLSVAFSVAGWPVIEDFSTSDHQYIAFEVVDAICRRALTRYYLSEWWGTSRDSLKLFEQTLPVGNLAVGNLEGW